jgi:hypothetical protein
MQVKVEVEVEGKFKTQDRSAGRKDAGSQGLPESRLAADER